MVMHAHNARPAGHEYDLTVEVYNNLDEISELWRAFERSAMGGPHDTFEWNDAWTRTAAQSSKPLIAVGRCISGEVLFLLPLSIQKHLGCDVLEWLGASQGNYSSGLFHPTAWRQGYAPQGEELLQVILDALPRVDAVHLDKNPEMLGGNCNPLASLPSIGEASAGYKFPIAKDFEAQINEKLSKRHRYKLRRSMRRLADEGEVIFKKVECGPESLEVLKTIIRDKKQWFAERGITNFFEDPAIRSFFETLVQLPDQKDGLSVSMYCLRVDDNIIASNINLIFQNTFYALIISTAYGPLRQLSPGRILFMKTVEDVAKNGIEAVDYGAGEDENKLRWCTEQRMRLHTLVPVSAKGRLYTSALKAELLVKAQIKQSPQLWSLAKRVRQWTSALRLPAATKPADLTASSSKA